MKLSTSIYADLFAIDPWLKVTKLLIVGVQFATQQRNFGYNGITYFHQSALRCSRADWWKYFPLLRQQVQSFNLTITAIATACRPFSLRHNFC